MDNLTVAELIERLATCDPDAEVLLAVQPGWPMQHQIMGVATAEDIAGETACDDHDAFNCDECEALSAVVYLVEGDHPEHPYAPHAAWAVAR